MKAKHREIWARVNALAQNSEIAYKEKKDHDLNINIDHDLDRGTSTDRRSDHDLKKSKKQKWEEFEKVRNDEIFSKLIHEIGVFEEVFVCHIRRKGFNRVKAVAEYVLKLYLNGYFREQKARIINDEAIVRRKAIKCFSDLLWNDKSFFYDFQ